MTKDEALRIALDALYGFIPYLPIGHDKAQCDKYNQAVYAIKEALETKEEPFEYWTAVEGWVKINEVREHFESASCGTIYKNGGEGRVPLYTTPQRTWVGLTDEDDIDWEEGGTLKDLVKAIEKKLKELNT